MGLPELVADSLSRPRASRTALARDFALAYLKQEKQLLLRTAELGALCKELQSLTMRHLTAQKRLSVRGVLGSALYWTCMVVSCTGHACQRSAQLLLSCMHLLAIRSVHAILQEQWCSYVSGCGLLVSAPVLGRLLQKHSHEQDFVHIHQTD